MCDAAAPGRIVRAVNTLHFTLRAAILSLGAASVAACGSSSNDSPRPTNDGGVASNTDGGVSIDKTPIDLSSMQPNTWTYVPVAGAVCRDGSPTGFALNLNPSSTNLVIYLEGGGACYNQATCIGTPACFSPPTKSGCLLTFDGKFGTSGTGDAGGILSRTDAANPVKDWNFVYVPFCTGDVHGGSKPNAMVPGVAAKQQFVGYTNMTRYLARLAPTFPGLTKVLLTGVSAGGFGSEINYPQTARAFAPVKVYGLDDSGPLMDDPYVPRCLQTEWLTLWGLDNLLSECGSDCPDHSNYMLDGVIHFARQYPTVPFGLIEDTDDMIITLFYGYGMNNCANTLLPTSVSGADFTAGLLDERAKLADAGISNAGSFIFQGSAHTSIGATSTFDSVTAGGGGGDGGADAAPPVKLSDWITTLVNDGTVTNVGP
jgi:hypothetical protein